MIDWVLSFLLGTIPGWVWFIVGGVAVGWAWRQFGWQGVVGGLLAILTLGAYRKGWRDRDASRPPIVPTGPIQPPQPAPRPRRRTLMDILNGR